MDAALVEACDANYLHGDRVLFGASQRGEVLESRDLHLSCCGFPSREFNRLRPKRASDLAAALERGERYFAERALPFVVEVRHDLEAACAPALRERGFARIAEVPGMVLAPIRAGGREVAGLEIREVAGEDDLARFQTTAFEGFGLPGALGPLFITPELAALPGVKLHLGLVDGEPACTSCLVRTADIAGVYWVATREAFRGRGLGEAITWAAVRGGAQAGCRAASLQASELGAPVYARMGFETPIRYRWYARPAPPEGAGGRA